MIFGVLIDIFLLVEGAGVDDGYGLPDFGDYGWLQIVDENSAGVAIPGFIISGLERTPVPRGGRS